MKCQSCGSDLVATVTDLPFKLSGTTIVILRGLPVHQCGSCSEYLLADSVMQRVEEMLGQVDPQAELEILRFAA